MSPMGCTGSLGVITVVATSIAAGSTRFSARGGAGPAGYFEATLAPQPIQADRERTVQLSLYSVSSLQSVESPTHAPATGQCRCLSPILPPALWFDAVEATGRTTTRGDGTLLATRIAARAAVATNRATHYM